MANANSKDASQYSKLLKSYGEKLSKELQNISGLTVKQKFEDEGTDTGGTSITLAHWCGGVTIELWLDVAAGGGRPMFWIGFYSEKNDDIRHIISFQPFLTSPRSELFPENWYKVDNNINVIENPESHYLNWPFAEFYHGDAFFGIYDRGHNVGEPSLDLWRAVAFISLVVESAKTIQRCCQARS